MQRVKVMHGVVRGRGAAVSGCQRAVRPRVPCHRPASHSTPVPYVSTLNQLKLQRNQIYVVRRACIHSAAQEDAGGAAGTCGHLKRPDESQTSVPEAGCPNPALSTEIYTHLDQLGAPPQCSGGPWCTLACDTPAICIAPPAAEWQHLRPELPLLHERALLLEHARP